MRCYDCGCEMERREGQTYRFVESGLQNVILEGATLLWCPRCGQGSLEVPELSPLMLLIGLSLVRKAAPLTNGEVRFLRKNTGQMQREFAALVGFTPEHYCQVERGDRAVSPQLDRLVRAVYALCRKDEIARYRSGVAAIDLIAVFKSISAGAEDSPIRVDLSKHRPDGCRSVAEGD